MTHRRRKRAYAENDTTDAKTRTLRGLCHKYFDSGWETQEWWPSRDAAYVWLQGFMNLPEKEAHISKFDMAQCQKLLVELQSYHETVAWKQDSSCLWTD